MMAPSDELSQWKRCLAKCFAERVSPKRFEAYALRLSRGLLDGKKILGLLLGHCSKQDPLLSQYLQTLLTLGCVEGHEVLQAVLESRRQQTNNREQVADKGNGTEKSKGSTICSETQDGLLRLVGTAWVNQQRPKTQNEARQILKVLSQWMTQLFKDHQPAVDQGLEDLSSLRPADHALLGTLATLFGTLADNEQIRHMFSQEAGTFCPAEADCAVTDSMTVDLEIEVPTALANFITLLERISPQIANQLGMFQHAYPYLRMSEPRSFGPPNVGDVGMGELQLAALGQQQVIRARGSLVMYLDALVSQAPFTSMQSISGYLQTRFRGEAGSLVIELILACFDLLTIARTRDEKPGVMFTMRSLIINKIPPFLAQISATLYLSANVGYLVAEAFRRLGPAMHPESNLGPSSFEPQTANATQQEVMPPFLGACLLHGLLDRNQAEQILTNDKMQSLSQAYRLDKDQLLIDIRNREKDIEQVVSDLETLDGNLSARAEAIFETLQQLCAAKDTGALKPLCCSLLTKSHALSAVCQFIEPSRFLAPICNLLDNWKHQDSQVDPHAAYEDFSACLLLVLTVVHRYSIEAKDLSFDTKTSFVIWTLEHGSRSASTEQLSSNQIDMLTEWTKALLGNEAIPDELLSRCEPQDFYNVAPIIFQQIGVAYSTGILTRQKVQNGFELLQQPIIAPSFCIGLPILIDDAWKRCDHADKMLDLLQIATQCRATTQEPNDLFEVVLGFLKESIEEIVQDSGLVHPESKSVEAMINRQTKTQSPQAFFDVTQENASQGTVSASSSMVQQLGTVFNVLCSWGVHGIFSSPPFWTYQMFELTVRLCGAARVVRALVDHVCLHGSSLQIGNEDDVSLDVAASMIIAHEIHGLHVRRAPRSSSLSLRQALQLDRTHAAKLVKFDTHRAQMIVQLHRLVETQLESQTLVDGLQTDMPPVLDPHQLPDVLAVMDHDAKQILDFQDPDNAFGPSMDMDLGSQPMFTQQDDNNNRDGQGSLDPGQQQLQDVQQGDNLSFRQPDEQADVSQLFGGQDAQGFFHEQVLGENFLTDDSAQQQGQQLLQVQPSLESDHNQGNQIMSDDDFWASLGIENDY